MRPSPSLVISCLALLGSLGGRASQPSTRGRAQQRRREAQLQTCAVDSLKVDSSLNLLDFVGSRGGEAEATRGLPGQGLRRDKGDRGSKGDTAAQGAPGLSGLTIVARTNSTTAGFQGVLGQRSGVTLS